MTDHAIRRRRLYHDRDLGGQNYLTCIHHGRQIGPISQQAAETGHAEGRRCPKCDEEIEAQEGRPDPTRWKATPPDDVLAEAQEIGQRMQDDAVVMLDDAGVFTAGPRFVGARPRRLGKPEPNGRMVVAVWYFPKAGTTGGWKMLS